MARSVRPARPLAAQEAVDAARAQARARGAQMLQRRCSRQTTRPEGEGWVWLKAGPRAAWCESLDAGGAAAHRARDAGAGTARWAVSERAMGAREGPNHWDVQPQWRRTILSSPGTRPPAPPGWRWRFPPPGRWWRPPPPRWRRDEAWRDKDTWPDKTKTGSDKAQARPDKTELWSNETGAEPRADEAEARSDEARVKSGTDKTSIEATLKASSPEATAAPSAALG